MRERGLINRRDTSVEDPPPNGRPIGEVVRDIVGHIAEIIRSEIRLATVELREDVVGLKAAAISIAIGNVLLIYAGIFLLLGLVYALSTIWPPWVAALVVGAGLAVIGGLVLRAGIQRIKQPRLK
jgi:uncharacterized membrane protein YqjE